MKPEDYKKMGLTPEQFESMLRRKCQEIAQKIDVPKGIGFALLMFDFGEGGFLTYVSNARREDMLKAMKEFIEKVGMEGSWN